MKFKAVPTTLMGLVSVFALNAPLSAVAAGAAGTVPIPVQRFACGAPGASSRYESLSNGNGLGPTNLFVEANLVGTNPPGPSTLRNAGYIAVPSRLQPPSASTGFRSFTLTFKDGVNGLANSRVQLSFEFRGGGRVRLTRSIPSLTVSLPDVNGFQTVTATAQQLDSFIDVSQGNLIKFAAYVETENSPSSMSFGNLQVQSGQGNYAVSGIKYNSATCPAIDGPL